MDLNDVPFYFKTVSEIIDGVGFADNSCGLHFHISSEKLQDIDMVKLMTFLHAEGNLFDGYLNRNEYVRSLEDVFLNSNIKSFNSDIKEQTKQYDIVYIDGNHIELRVFGGADIYKKANDVLNRLTAFLDIHRVGCIPDLERELYKELIDENLSKGHHTMNSADLAKLESVTAKIMESSDKDISEAFKEAFNLCEKEVLVPQTIIDDFQEMHSTTINTI
jgi:hypothetical protein